MIRRILVKPTTVVFNGVAYHRFPNTKTSRASRNYFCNQQNKQVRWLHRDVWQYYRGPIPKGYHIHHKYENDRHTTDPNRLACISKPEHTSVTNKGKPKTAAHRAALSAARTGMIVGPMSEAHKAAISNGKLGKPLTEAQYAHFLDPVGEAERRRKLSEAAFKRWAKWRENKAKTRTAQAPV